MEYKAFIAKSESGKDRYLDNAPTFYEMFPHDHRIEVNPNIILLEENTYIKLLATIYSSLQRNILIVAHLNPDYGSLNFRFGTEQEWPFWKTAFWILHYGKVENIYNKIKYEKNPEKWLILIKYLNLNTELEPHNMKYNLETAWGAYLRLIMLDNLMGKTKEELEIEQMVDDYKKLPIKTKEDESIKIKKAVEIVNFIKIKKIESQVNTLKSEIKMSETLMNDYLNILRKIHTLKLNSLVIRGCEVGAQWGLLDMMRLFFNVQHINAPKCWVYYGQARVLIQEKQWFFREAAKQTSKKWLGRNLEPKKWIGGKTTYLTNPRDENKRGIYYHAEGLKTRKDELLFFTFPRKDNPNDNRVVLIAEHINIVMNFFEKNFGKVSPAKANITRKFKLRNQYGTMMNSRGQYLLLPYCYLDTTPIVFPQNAEFNNYICSISQKRPDYIYG